MIRYIYMCVVYYNKITKKSENWVKNAVAIEFIKKYMSDHLPIESGLFGF